MSASADSSKVLDLQESLSKAHHELEEKREEIQQQQEEIEQHTVQLGNKSKKIVSQGQQIKQLGQQIKQLEQQLQIAQGQDSSNEGYDELQEQLAASRRDNDELSFHLDGLTSRIKDLERENSYQVEENSVLRQENSDIREENSKLKQEKFELMNRYHAFQGYFVPDQVDFDWIQGECQWLGGKFDETSFQQQGELVSTVEDEQKEVGVTDLGVGAQESTSNDKDSRADSPGGRDPFIPPSAANGSQTALASQAPIIEEEPTPRESDASGGVDLFGGRQFEWIGRSSARSQSDASAPSFLRGFGLSDVARGKARRTDRSRSSSHRNWADDEDDAPIDQARRMLGTPFGFGTPPAEGSVRVSLPIWPMGEIGKTQDPTEGVPADPTEGAPANPAPAKDESKSFAAALTAPKPPKKPVKPLDPPRSFYITNFVHNYNEEDTDTGEWDELSALADIEAAKQAQAEALNTEAESTTAPLTKDTASPAQPEGTTNPAMQGKVSKAKAGQQSYSKSVAKPPPPPPPPAAEAPKAKTIFKPKKSAGAQSSKPDQPVTGVPPPREPVPFDPPRSGKFLNRNDDEAKLADA